MSCFLPCGKAGVPQELGLGVWILEDQSGYILHHHGMENQKDVYIAVMMVFEMKRRYAALSGCSFDKGFYSPKNKEKLQGLLDEVFLPKKAKFSQKDKQIEHSQEFIEARHKHAAVESAINALENLALDRCPDHGIWGFKRYVTLAVLARNLQLLDAKIRQKELKRQKNDNRPWDDFNKDVGLFWAPFLRIVDVLFANKFSAGEQVSPARITI